MVYVVPQGVEGPEVDVAHASSALLGLFARRAYLPSPAYGTTARAVVKRRAATRTKRIMGLQLEYEKKVEGEEFLVGDQSQNWGSTDVGN